MRGLQDFVEGKYTETTIGSGRPAAPDTAVLQPCKCRPPCGQGHACTHRAGLNELLAHPMLLSRAWLTGAEYRGRPGQLCTHQAGTITRCEGCSMLQKAKSALLLALAPSRHCLPHPTCGRQKYLSCTWQLVAFNENGCPLPAPGPTCSPSCLVYSLQRQAAASLERRRKWPKGPPGSLQHFGHLQFSKVTARPPAADGLGWRGPATGTGSTQHHKEKGFRPSKAAANQRQGELIPSHWPSTASLSGCPNHARS